MLGYVDMCMKMFLQEKMGIVSFPVYAVLEIKKIVFLS